MPKTILLEEFHLSVYVPAALRKAECNAAVRTLRSRRFQASLDDAMRKLFRRRPTLRHAEFTIDR